MNRALWIVEMKYDGESWFPTTCVEYTRKEARETASRLRDRTTETRVRRYIPDPLHP